MLDKNDKEFLKGMFTDFSKEIHGFTKIMITKAINESEQRIIGYMEIEFKKMRRAVSVDIADLLERSVLAQIDAPQRR